MVKKNSKITAPSVPEPKKIEVTHLSTRHRILVIDEHTDQPLNYINKGNKSTMNNSNNSPKKVIGITYLAVKVSLLIASIAMFKMDFIHFLIDIPLYQVVGGVLISVLLYLELEPYFSTAGKKSKKESKIIPNRKPSDFIETAI
jgi:hypothetical protein